MTLHKLYNLITEATESSNGISDQVLSLQRKISFAARKCYQTHLNGSLFTKKEYTQKLKEAWAKYTQLKQQYKALLDSREDDILMDATLVEKIKQFKNKHPQIFT